MTPWAGRHRVLLSAYQCGPGADPAAQAGWEWYSRLSQRVNVTLVTHERNRAALEGAGAPLPDTDLFFVETDWLAAPAQRIASRFFHDSASAASLVSILDFIAFDRHAARFFRRRWKRGQRWDIVHQPTPADVFAPTRLDSLGAPVVLGPLSIRPGTPSAARRLLTLLGPRCRAGTILAATPSSIDALPSRYRARCLTIEDGFDPENGRGWDARIEAALSLFERLSTGRSTPAGKAPLYHRASP